MDGRAEGRRCEARSSLRAPAPKGSGCLGGARANGRRRGGAGAAPPAASRAEPPRRRARLRGETGEAGSVRDSAVVEEAAVATHRLEEAGEGARRADRRSEVAV